MGKIKVGTKEWLEIRRTKICASDAPILMGVSPYCTPLQLYHRKINGREIEQTAAMKRGSDMEEEARNAFEQMTGHFVAPEFRISEDYDWMAASFDGINEQGVVVEIKCPNKKDHELAINGKVPEHYIYQCYHQMVVAKVNEMYYFSYSPYHLDPCAIVKVENPQCLIQRMLSKEQQFYHCLVNKIPPEPTDEDVQTIDDEDFLSKERRLRYLMEEHKKMEENIELVRNQLIEQCNGKKTQGLHLRYSPSFCQGSVEYKSIPQLKGVDLDEFRKPGYTKWRIDLL